METFIAQCIVLPVGSDAPHAATLAGRAIDSDALTSRARETLAITGHRLVSLENVTPAQDHLRRHGETELVAALLAAVSDAAPVQVSGFYPTNTAAAAHKSDPVLLVETYAITPLEVADTRPFWDRPWCPPELAKLLFEGTPNTFMIVDAAKRGELRKGFDIDALEMTCDTACLYSGAAAFELREVAPYLLDLTPFAAPDARIPAPLRDLFTTQWNGGSTLYLRTEADFETLHKHLRRFLRIRSSDDAEHWTVFRFWDPAVARVYFPGIASRPERVDRIFRVAADVPLEMVTGEGAQALRLVPRDPTGPAAEAKPIVFDAQDHALMQSVADTTFRAETADWLRTGYPDRFAAFDAAQMDGAVAHIMAEGRRVGCVSKDDFAYLAHMMITLGGWFHITGYPTTLVEILHDQTGDLHSRLSRAFLPAWQASPQAAVMAVWQELRAHLSALPVEAQVTPQEFGAVTARFLQPHANSVNAALAATKQDLAGLDLPLPAQGRLLLLTLIYGHRFYVDPLRGWAGQPTAQTIDTVWQATLE
ncbi:DUF4123 domain-containing protein [Litoreibacter janthinus]|uniref:DUF4123 domain-containing protein n=1 Tax=Litoreibacter janthinus TaxID=670154 RepID=A0A1I6IES7_9RHOB|nr:DUF4123 domain-containing protein [Litoreibacter janthinus]SFR65201.1 protein of unknown function [Litoreibacter janthinus]